MTDQREFLNKYDDAIQRFPFPEEVKHTIADEEALLFELATVLNHRGQFEPHETLDKVQELFPDLWVQALEQYFRGPKD